LDANAELDDSSARVQDPLRRASTRVSRLHRNSDALCAVRRGDVFEVRPGAEVLAALDVDACLDPVPFVPVNASRVICSDSEPMCCARLESAGLPGSV
jgi:hypothetical protein